MLWKLHNVALTLERDFSPSNKRERTYMNLKQKNSGDRRFFSVIMDFRQVFTNVSLKNYV